jgi:DNA-binding NarL/FixJ family response regulator
MSPIVAKAAPIKAQIRGRSASYVGSIRILTASSQSSLRRILRELLTSQADFILVGEARNDDEVISLVAERKPDILLLDFSVRTEAAFEVLQRLQVSRTGAQIILLTTRSVRLDVVRLMKLGGRGVVSANSPTPLLLKSIRSVFRGEIWLKRQDLADVVTMLTLATRPITARSPVHLTPRQYEVLKVLASGGTNREVARILSVSEDTVKHHITKILDKTGMSSRVELALYAVEHGLLDIA